MLHSRTIRLLFLLIAGSAASSGSQPTPVESKRKDVLLRRIAEQFRHNSAPFLGKARVKALEERIASFPADAPSNERYGLRLLLANALLQTGEVERSIAEFEALLKVTIERSARNDYVMIAKRLAMAWLRLGERQNCIARHNEESCLLPLRGQALHVDRTGSTNAIHCLQRVLEAEPGDEDAIWLLNVAHMTLGTWPDKVPAAVRIPASAFASEHELPRMVNVANDLGLDPEMTLAGGGIADDFDGDGRLDLMTSSMDAEQPLRLLRQQADGRFVDVAEQVGLAGQLGGLNLVHFDANGDGRLDVLVQRGAWMKESGEIPNSLLIQQEDGTFADRTREAGIEIAAPSQVAAVADIDNDGDVDLFLGYESNVGPGGSVTYPSHLFRNRGDGTFEDVTAAAGVSNDRFCKGAAFGDYDGDGRADLYVANMSGWNRLYRNLGGCKFRDVAVELGVAAPLDSFGCWFFDYDNDGRLDLFVTSYSQDGRMADMVSWYRNRTTGRDVHRLYENDGKGGFRDVTRERALDRVAFPMGCNFGDVDNDGWPDVYLATGEPEFSALWPNVLYRNDRGQRFQDVTTATGTGHLQKGHGVAFSDLDADGDQDLFVQMGGAFEDDRAADALFQNPGHGHRWLTVRLTGKRSNRFAVGARIRVRIEEPSGERDVYAFTGASSSFGGNSLQDEIGLGDARRIVELEVRWPATGAIQVFRDVPLDRVIAVEEGAAAPTFPEVPRCKPLAPRR